jgi:hypothetical protein
MMRVERLLLLIYLINGTNKGKSILYRPGRLLGLEEVEATLNFKDNRHTKVASLASVRTGRLYAKGITMVLISVRG